MATIRSDLSKEFQIFVFCISLSDSPIARNDFDEQVFIAKILAYLNCAILTFKFYRFNRFRVMVF